jgi:hypothetical protein
LTVIREYPRERYLRYRLDRSLPGALVNHASIAAITVEAGPRNVLGSKEAQLVRDSVMSVLGCAGLTAWSQATHPTNRNQGGPWRRESGPRCRHTGLLISLLEPGHKFAARQPLAEVHDLTGRRLETLCAKTSGIVVALPDRAWVTEGVSCATLAVPDE